MGKYDDIPNFDCNRAIANELAEMNRLTRLKMLQEMESKVISSDTLNGIKTMITPRYIGLKDEA